MKRLGFAVLITFLLVTGIFTFLIFSGILPAPRYEPEDGIWYCAELQIQLSYEQDVEGFIVKNGEKILTTCGSDQGVKKVFVLCSQEKHPDYPWGELMFSAEIISLDEESLVVYDEQTDKSYIFMRID